MIAQISFPTRPVGDGGKCRYPAEIGRLYFLECLVYIVYVGVPGSTGKVNFSRKLG